MPERCVHLFEAIDVEHHDRDATEVVDRLLQTIDEKDAVGEAREPVVQRLMPGALLHAVALADVFDREADSLVGERRTRGRRTRCHR